MDGEMRISHNQKGFSLLEVMIAITLFAFFVTAFLTSQGYNVSDSSLSQEQLTLQLLCEKKINELYINPPKFSNVTANTKDTKTFEEEDYRNYEWTLEIKKIVVPDFGQLMNQQAASGAAADPSASAGGGGYMNANQKNNRNSTVEKIIFDELKKNIEKVIWQAKVTVTNKDTKLNYSLATFITNYDEKIQLNISF
jgi:prepilin-type N-terminal cleavage/methylation domain-containing protein